MTTSPPPDPPEHPRPALVVDARGRRCPVPVIELARTVRNAPAGTEAEVYSDDPASAADIPAWCRMRGHRYLGSRPLDVGSAFRVRIQDRSEPGAR